jgi:hypothetical protein
MEKGYRRRRIGISCASNSNERAGSSVLPEENFNPRSTLRDFGQQQVKAQPAIQKLP